MNAARHAFARGAHDVRIVEAAPARRRIAALMSVMLIVFGALGVRATHLALTAPAPAAARPPTPEVARADLQDRNGVPLALTTPTWTLIARPAEVWRPAEVAQALAAVAPDLDRATLERRLTAADREVVYLKRGLGDAERERIFALGLPGVDFDQGRRRVYPQGALAAHLIGGARHDFIGAAGVELGLDREIRATPERPLRLSLDARVQHAAERELDAAVATSQAKGGAAIVLNGRTGEILALASAPRFNLNTPPAGDDPVRLNRAVGAVYELGSVVKPFVFAAALDQGVVDPAERFASEPFVVDGLTVQDLHPAEAPLDLSGALAESSNIAAARVGLRLGVDRVVGAFEAVGLLERLDAPLPEAAAPLGPRARRPATAAAMSYGYGFAAAPLALAQAYTMFCNDGAIAAVTLRALNPDDAPALRQVVAAPAARAVLDMMRAVVVEGTGRAAAIEGVAIAGKTGTAEKPKPGGGYDPDRMIAAFAGVFPASDPRYVVVTMLDEPRRTAATGGQATGGAVAAPAAGRLAARAAPFLDAVPGLVPQKAPPARGGSTE